MAPKKNAFFFFMMDYKKQAEANGKRFPGGMRDVQADAECSAQWKALSDAQRKKYTDRANGGERPKLTTTGEPIAEVEARAKRRIEYAQNMRRDIEETVQLAEISKKVPDQPFFLIHVNYFYSKEAMDNSLTYIPAEIALCMFSIGEGCKKFYHQIINIDVELGYRLELMEHAEDSHKLKPDYEHGEKDYTKILKKFQDFLEPERVRTGKMPPVYTTKRHSPVVKCFLDRLAITADNADWKGNKQIANLYELEILFGKLMAAANSDLVTHGLNATILAQEELEKESFAYTPNIECGFHQKIDDVSIYCSLGIVRQWIFQICDYCCHRFGVKMVKDVHCPADAAYDDVDFLASHMTSINLSKERKIGYVKSATGVSQAYRESKASRTPEQEERRRREAMKAPPLTIIDYSKNQPAPSTDTYQQNYLKPLRVPKSLAVAVKGSENSPSLDDANFPSLGGPRKLFGSKLVAGRGRGGVPTGK